MDRKIVAESGSRGHEVVAALLAGDGEAARRGYLYAIVRDRYWTAVAVKPEPVSCRICGKRGCECCQPTW